jgi:hypothetical protein
MQKILRLLGDAPLALLLCASASSAQAQQYPEVNVTSVAFTDIEFDSARDGVYCASCNFGEGNSRFNWTDKTGKLWLGHVNWRTGAFIPRSGKAELVDTNAAYWRDFGNGAEWAFSQQGSQLVYTRFVPGMPQVPTNAGAALATMVAGKWTAGFLPGAIGSDGITGPVHSALPEASQAGSDPVALVMYNNYAVPLQMFWEQCSLSGVSPNLTPFGSYSDGISVRWVPQTHQLLFIGFVTNPADGQTYQQVFWYDTDTNAVAQLTSDPTDKNDAFLFQAPDFSDNYIFLTRSGETEVDIYEQTNSPGVGPPTFQQINQITSTDPTEPLIASAEPFINCTPQCVTYVLMALTGTQKVGTALPNGLAVATINPAQPKFTVLASAYSPAAQRTDPEYFITSKGPFVYYGRVLPATLKSPTKIEGTYYIDMQLGAPTGPCVGSSAEGGLIAGC